jgi:hypothetical protein
VPGTTFGPAYSQLSHQHKNTEKARRWDHKTVILFSDQRKMHVFSGKIHTETP